jgi:hypothetical protein
VNLGAGGGGKFIIEELNGQKMNDIDFSMSVPKDLNLKNGY